MVGGGRGWSVGGGVMHEHEGYKVSLVLSDVGDG